MKRLMILVVAMAVGLGGCAGFYVAGDAGTSESHPHLVSARSPD
jgi:hypothetical protein